MNSFIERVANYCKKISGQDMSIGVMNKRNLNRFPLTITDTYTCYDAVIMGVPVVLLEVHGDYTPMQLQKHQNVVTKLAGICSVFAIENVAYSGDTRSPIPVISIHST